MTVCYAVLACSPCLLRDDDSEVKMLTLPDLSVCEEMYQQGQC